MYEQSKTEAKQARCSTTDRKQVSQRIFEEIDREKIIRAEEERKAKRSILVQEEKGKTGQLLELGKLCYFVEAFDNIPLVDQNIQSIGLIENPVDTKSFSQGYTIDGPRLVKQGFTEEHYHRFLETYENKYLKNTQTK